MKFGRGQHLRRRFDKDVVLAQLRSSARNPKWMARIEKLLLRELLP